MSRSLNISIVIPTHNRNDLLRRTLDSLEKLELPKNYRETIVVENGGAFGAEQVALAAAPNLNVRYEYYEQGNKSAALNHVLDIVEDDLLVFFDDDIRVTENLLQQYATMAQDWPDCFFGGPMDCDYEKEPEPWVKLPASALGWRPNKDRDLLFLGCNWAAFAAHLRASGGFDSRVGPGGTTGARGQETFMQASLREHGYLPRFVPEALVWHYVPAKNCSKEWALHRAYQNGIQWSLQAGQMHSREQTNECSTLFGVPRWRLRKLVASLGHAVFYSAIQRKCEAHKHWYDFQHQKGIIAGLRNKITTDKNTATL